MFQSEDEDKDPQEELEKIEKRLQQNNVIARVANSKRKIKTERFRKYLKEAMIFRKKHWSWAYLPNAIHEAYGHLVDAIIANGGRGLGQRSEVHSSFT